MRPTAPSLQGRSANRIDRQEDSTSLNQQSLPSPKPPGTLKKKKIPYKERFTRLPTIAESISEASVGGAIVVTPKPEPHNNSQSEQLPRPFSRVIARPTAEELEIHRRRKQSSSIAAGKPAADNSPVLTEAYSVASTPRPLSLQDRNASFNTSTSSSSATPATGLQTQAAMAQLNNNTQGHAAAGRDEFDTLNWDLDLPYENATDGSPEPVSIQPKPVAYTTVGSLVDPTARLHFAPPNRLQRDNGGRQPFVPTGQRGQYENFQDSRGSPLPLQMANSMAYAQQITNSPGVGSSSSDGVYPTPSPLSMSTQSFEMLELTNQDIMAMGEMRHSHELSGNMAIARHPSTPSSSSRLSARAPSFNTRQHMEENGNQAAAVESESDRIAAAQQQSLTGDNAYTRLQPSSNMPRVALPGPTHDRMVPLINRGRDQSNGELRQANYFSSSGLQSHQTTQPNPLLAATTSQPVADRSYPPGYPHPLTAGPPGQRQRPTAMARSAATNNMDHAWANGQSSSHYGPDAGFYGPNDNSSNPGRPSIWNNTLPVPPVHVYDDPAHFSSLPKGYIVPRSQGSRFANSRGPPTIKDTLPPASVARYYPYGIPGNMTGAFTPLSEDAQKKIDDLALTEEEKKARKRQELNNWFYGGQRRFAAMDAEDRTNEPGGHQRASTNQFGPIAPPEKAFPSGPIVKKPFTEEDMKNMTPGEAAKPLIDAAFRTLLLYAEQGSNSRNPPNGPTAASPRQINDRRNENNRYSRQN